MRFGWIGVVAVLVVASWADGDERADGAFAKGVAGYVENHCLACHAGARAKGDLDLARFADASAVRAAPALWRNVARRVQRGEMPPPKRAQPPAAETRAFLDWLARHLPKPDTAARRVTLRRLNRVEYENTVRDLLGVDFPAHERLPADDVGHGFDNNGDVLSLPPALLEKYMDAAEEIAARAIVEPDTDPGPPMRVEGGDLQVSGGGRRTATGVWMSSHGSAHAQFHFSRDGEYLVRVRAFGQQAGDEPCRLALVIGKQRRGEASVPGTHAHPDLVEFRARIKRGTHRVAAAFINDYYNPRHPDRSQRDRNLKVEQIEVYGPIDMPVSPPMQARLLPEGAALATAVEALARRAFRRPLAASERDRLLATVKAAAPTGASKQRRMRIAITALLVSPRFLFRLELDENPERARELDAWELASRLSYFLWASMPDERLFRLAGAGRLLDPAVLRGEVARMVRDPRASVLAERFAVQWLQIGRLDEAAFDPDHFPRVDDDLKSAMRAESVLFFEAILREGRPVTELLDADFTYVNERLAKLYGLPGVRGPRMRRVRLGGRRRGGVLTQASVLASTSNPTRTSPVKRGQWVLDALLDAAPPPPPEVVALDESARAVASGTLRARLAAHRSDPACMSCHVRMDVLGFALEHFDAIGRWRARDGRFPVDASGVLPDGTRLDGAADLRDVIKRDPAFLRAFAKRLFVYALGRGAGEADEATLRAIAQEWGAGRPTLPRLIEAIVLSDAFTRRGSEDPRE